MKWIIGILILVAAIGIGFGFAWALRAFEDLKKRRTNNE